MRKARAVAALSTVLLATMAGQARAQTSNSDLTMMDERTAYMLGAKKLKLGLLAFEYGITDRMTIGTEPPAWAARAFLPILIPNLHFKFQFFENDRVAVMGNIAGYYADLSKTSASEGALFSFPLSLFVSTPVANRVWVHSEGTFLFARATGAGDVDRADVEGAVATRAGQLGVVVEWRVKRTFSLTASGRYQFYAADLAFKGTGTVDEFTTAQTAGQLAPRVRHPWQALVGVVFLWKYVHLSVGGGYGYYFIPGFDIAVPKQTFIPDASLSVIL
jgi:hypothetical protein